MFSLVSERCTRGNYWCTCTWLFANLFTGQSSILIKKMASVYSDISTFDEEFPEITQEQQTFISRAFTTSLLGSYVNHRWYVYIYQLCSCEILARNTCSLIASR